MIASRGGLTVVTALLLANISPVVMPAAAADFQLLGPTPYTSFGDSPFKALFPSSFSYFHLNDFEGDVTPGYTVNAGHGIGPSGQTDSVDGDGPTTVVPTGVIPSGNLNGTGTDGSSWLSSTTDTLTFTFIASALGGKLPTHVGIVWTDVGLVAEDVEFPMIEFGRSHVEFSAYGPGGEFLDGVGTGNGMTLGDGSVAGGTSEDRFFGVINAAGISRIDIFTRNSQDWEVDHLQYGALNPVPEPEQWLLMALGVGAIVWRLQRSRATNVA